MKMRPRAILCLVLLTALVLRVGWSLSRSTDLSALPDQTEYLEIANNLIAGKGLAFFDPSVNEAVYAFRMPGYPVFVAICGANVTAVRIVQALLDTSTALAIYLLLPAAFERRNHIRLVAAGLVAFNPYLIYFSATILSETLFTALLAWGMVLLIRQRWYATFCGLLLLILSVYVRPGAIGLPILTAIAAQLVRPTVHSSRSFWRVPAGTTAIILLFLALLPWAIRNRYHQRVGAWIFTTTNTGITLYDGMNPLADGSSNQAAFRGWPELQSKSEVERSNYFAAQAKQYAMENPKRALWLGWQKIARTWSPIPLSAEYGSNRLYVSAGLVFAVPLFVLTVLGMWYGPISRSLKLFLLLPAVYFTIVHAITVGSLRYRVPADAPMSIVAATGVAGWLSRRKQIVSPPEAVESHS